MKLGVPDAVIERFVLVPLQILPKFVPGPIDAVGAAFTVTLALPVSLSYSLPWSTKRGDLNTLGTLLALSQSPCLVEEESYSCIRSFTLCVLPTSITDKGILLGLYTVSKVVGSAKGTN